MQFVRPLALILAIVATQSGAGDVPRPVKLMTATASDLELQRRFFGQVAAKRSVDLAFQVGGQVVELPVLEGQRIARGTVIAVLDQVPFELRRDQAVLRKEQADRTFARMKRLEGSTISEVSLQDAETEVGLAAITLRDAEWALQQSTLTAPFDGLVSSRNVDLFSTVSAGTPVVRMHDLSEYRIQIDVPEILFQRVDRPDNLTLTAHFPTSPQAFELEILEFDAETSGVGQTFRTTLGMAPPEGLNILPGSSVTVDISAFRGQSAILLPSTALVMNPGGDTGVMRFVPTSEDADTGTVAWTPVAVEPERGGESRVVSGLEDGTEIVAVGGGALEDGQTVRRFTGFSN